MWKEQKGREGNLMIDREVEIEKCKQYQTKVVRSLKYTSKYPARVWLPQTQWRKELGHTGKL